MSENLYRRKDGRYEARISLGKDSEGKRKYHSVYGKTPEEVDSKLSALGRCRYSITEMTVKEISLEYPDTVKPQLKESTLANYRMKAEKHIIPAFGDKCCCLLTADDVYAFIGKKRKIGMSARYIADIVVLLKGIYRFAARTHNIRNPLDSFKMPKTAKSDVAVLSEHDQHRLIALATTESDIKHFGAVLSMFTGMRIGELCALKWGDIDLDSRTIHVRRTLQRIQTGNSAKRTKIVITEPKSASSVRDKQALEIVDRLADRYIKWVERMKEKDPYITYKGESGGMLEMWAELYSLTGNEKYNTLIDLYKNSGLYSQLEHSADGLSDDHVNASIPLSHGAARMFEVTGDEYWSRITDLFWKHAVTDRGMYATTGSNAGEF